MLMGVDPTEPFSPWPSNVSIEMPNEPDEVLLQRFVDGDRAAFATLFRTFERDVHRWIMRIVRDRSVAEDGVVEAFWRCHRTRARFDPSRSFGAWMRRIATHVAIDLLNKTRRHSWIPFDELVAPLAAPADPSGTGRQLVARSIVRAFNSLPTKLRVVATLALIEERPQAEIADALGVPIGTVKSRLSRATQKLRKDLEGLEMDT
jgi:RNA polymerase sigma-70 factor, ECF subfamily